jgi:hypothetical protein
MIDDGINITFTDFYTGILLVLALVNIFLIALTSKLNKQNLALDREVKLLRLKDAANKRNVAGLVSALDDDIVKLKSFAEQLLGPYENG